jgi:hypothetical protein
VTKQFRPQTKNANRHTEHGLRLLEKSVQSDGWIDAQTAAADGEMISGTARLEVSAEKFGDVEPIIVESDGTRPVIVVRTDIPDLNDPRARRLSVAANQIAYTDYAPDMDLLKEWAEEDHAIRAMFADSEWQDADVYTKKIEAPIYEVKGEKPHIEDLYDNDFYIKLVGEIELVDIPENIKEFLKIAATRHIVFNFSQIAEYYSHSPANVQRLMENSALVIIDFNRAIELGYVRLSDKIAEQFAQEYPND